VLRSLLSIFFADSYRFGDKNFEEAKKKYRDAIVQTDALAERHPSVWNRAWTRYFLADCMRETGCVEEAAALCDEAFPIGEKDRDFEILANIFRVRGDLAIVEGKIDSAIGLYHQAISNAYLFQIEPSPPDSYTVVFYPHIVLDVVRRILNMNREISLDIAIRLRNIWQDDRNDTAEIREIIYAQDPNVERVAWILFPPPFDKSNLDDTSATENYEKNVLACLRRLEVPVSEKCQNRIDGYE
jgi:tetratricopeptide (TPR) repeat protein